MYVRKLYRHSVVITTKCSENHECTTRGTQQGKRDK